MYDPIDPLSSMRDPDGSPPATVLKRIFPVFDLASDGFAGIAPAGCFHPSLTGAHDMIGNVWEWTDMPVT